MHDSPIEADGGTEPTLLRLVEHVNSNLNEVPLGQGSSFAVLLERSTSATKFETSIFLRKNFLMWGIYKPPKSRPPPDNSAHVPKSSRRENLETIEMCSACNPLSINKVAKTRPPGPLY